MGVSKQAAQKRFVPRSDSADPDFDAPRFGMLGRFTPRARNVVQNARTQALEQGYAEVGNEHVVLGLLSEPDGIAAETIAALGPGLDQVRAAVLAVLDPADGRKRPSRVRFSRSAKKTLELSLREALHLGHNYIGTEHLLLGLLRNRQRPRGPPAHQSRHHPRAGRGAHRGPTQRARGPDPIAQRLTRPALEADTSGMENTEVSAVEIHQAESEPVAAAPMDRSSMADSRASIRYDTFLFAAAATVLITRTYLKLTGYPQVGGHSQLHVAHVLWGGLLLLVAMSIMMVSVGSAAKFWASLIGGIGFGLFIDEVGKFLTKDVNYFFKPAIAIIYGVLITAYVIGRETLRRIKLDGPRTRALVAIGIADNQLGQLTRTRRDTLRALLANFSDDESDRLLHQLLDATPPRPRRTSEEWAATIIDSLHRMFIDLAARRWIRRVVITIIVIEVLEALAEVLYVVIAVWLTNIDTHRISPSDYANFAGDVVELVVVGGGLILLARHDWRRGLEVIRAGLFFTLLYTTLMQFADQQLHALTDFALGVVLFSIVGAAAEAERRGEIRPSVPRARPGRGKRRDHVDRLDRDAADRAPAT